MTDFLVKRDDLRECRIAESEPPEIELGPGAAAGRHLRADGQQRHLRCDSARRCPTGTSSRPRTAGDGCRCGALPRSSRATSRASSPAPACTATCRPPRIWSSRPSASTSGGFVDGSPHRAALPSAYHRYLATATDPFYRADTEAMQMLLRPLFFTSFLIDDQLDDEGLTDARADPDLQRLEQDGDRRRLPAGPARGGRADRAHLARQRRVRRRASGSTTAPSPMTRSTRSIAARPPSSTSPATARSALRSTPTTGTSSSTAWPSGMTHWEELRCRGRTSCRARRRSSSSPRPE